MELLSEIDIKSIAKHYGVEKVLGWKTQDFEENVGGYIYNLVFK